MDTSVIHLIQQTTGLQVTEVSQLQLRPKTNLYPFGRVNFFPYSKRNRNEQGCLYKINTPLLGGTGCVKRQVIKEVASQSKCLEVFLSA